MRSSETQNTNGTLERMWDCHRDFLKRLLIGLTHDIDLTDDLLQDTHVRAWSGMATYRGGDARAWLATIAKNTFYSHVRRKYVQSEAPLSSDIHVAEDPPVDHLTMLEIRRAVSGLPPALRAALIMKHYGGYTYQEIARRLGCPTGTAKRRVSIALKKLRQALAVVAEEAPEMKCSRLVDRLLLDFVYGKLTRREAEAIEKHLGECAGCRARGEEVRSVLMALDAAGADVKSTSITELDGEGRFTTYMSMSFPNDSDETMRTLTAGGNWEEISCVLAQGEDAPYEPVGSEEEGKARKWEVQLPRPVPPGERVELLIATKPTRSSDLVKLDDHTWRFGPGKLHVTDELVYVFAVRLPAGASLLKATPKADEVRTNGATTVLWRSVLPADEQREFWLDYRL